MLSPVVFSAPAGKVKSPLPLVELPRKVQFSQTENACAPPPESDTRCTPVADGE
jgi:hypothetical protein